VLISLGPIDLNNYILLLYCLVPSFMRFINLVLPSFLLGVAAFFDAFCASVCPPHLASDVGTDEKSWDGWESQGLEACHTLSTVPFPESIGRPP